MISLLSNLPCLDRVTAESIKIKCLFDCYANDDRVMFWQQDDARAIISMTDGNMIIHNRDADIEELCEFVDIMSPACVFSDYETLCALNRKPQERINIMNRACDIEGETEGDFVSSREIYDLLDVDGLSLPEYPYFAVDYCRRLNHGGADFFALKDKCAVISFKSEDNAIINGIAAKQKGYGTVALRAIMQKNCGRALWVCCRDKVKGFYEKNGFELQYFAGYWVKNK